MRKMIYGLATGILAGLLFAGTCKRGEPVETEETEYTRMEREVKTYLREDRLSAKFWEYEPFFDIPLLEKIRFGEMKQGYMDINSKYSSVFCRYRWRCVS